MRTALRKENNEQVNFKKPFQKLYCDMTRLMKHSKFQNFDEIFDCGMTRLRNTTFNYCDLC